ncbi:uncharacterized protein CELE_T14F9.2 [Caenorhabditis elegans]|uniref:Uncharacterized protein n=1 Tax=Caenorhabditis elegans TaxID=6239 RepID=Q22493_CAEEL|nr:Uncharacterized protein CELE_T14F9.2 [Caenorhabditis elegans]CCD68945.1 Uncharacterized protein CELE_T14F9.2 [Caenorhabditis elegans]|eukprot:NP_508411.2 Uncharacterized protein CELE_T14F9.2 [Caenorhabditis elegans]
MSEEDQSAPNGSVPGPDAKAWPELTVDLEPEVWRALYREKHGEKFRCSVEMLMELEEISCEIEAEQKLLDILVKVTFIERNLCLNGPQSGESLFESLEEARSDEQPLLFATVSDLTSFCDSMKPIFQTEKVKGTLIYRNSGYQSRRFIQYIRRRLEPGDVIDSTTFRQVIQDFQETIGVPDSVKTFAKSELTLDFTSLRTVARNVPGFRYDKSLERLDLTPEAEHHLPLHLPIFTETLDFNNPHKHDYSRVFSCYVRNDCTQYPNRLKGTVVSETGLGIGFMCFQDNMKDYLGNDLEKGTFNAANYRFLAVEGNINPSNLYEQFEVFKVVNIPFGFDNNLVTTGNETIYRVHFNLEKVDSTFENVQTELEATLRRVVHRTRKSKEDNDNSDD